MVGTVPPLLVAATDPLVRGLLLQLLQEWGFQAQEAANLSELLERLAQSDYSLAVVEHLSPTHPQHDLWPVLPVFRGVAPQIPVVALYSETPPPEGPPLVASLLLADAVKRLRKTVERHARRSIDAPFNPRLALYLRSLWQWDIGTALSIAEDALGAGASIPEVFDGLLAAGLHQLGEWWGSGGCRVADEHGARVITEEVMIRVYARTPITPLGGRQALLACVPGEFHEIAIKMAGYLLRLEGWNVRLLGANTPAMDLVRLSERSNPNLVALSATVPVDKSVLSQVIAALKQRSTARVILGGDAFAGRAEALQLGADGYVAQVSQFIPVVQQSLS